MLRKLLLTSVITAFALAGKTAPVTSEPYSDVKAHIEKEIVFMNKSYKEYGVSVKNRKVGLDNQSYSLVASPIVIDKNTSIDSLGLVGLKINNDMNYTTDGYNSTMYLTALPKDMNLTKDEQKLLTHLVKDKTIEVYTNYNIKTKEFKTTLKDINETTPEAIIKISGINIDGLFDIDKPEKQIINLSIGDLNIKAKGAKFKGEHLNLKNAFIKTESVLNKNSYDVVYKSGMELLDSNLEGKSLHVEKANIDVKIGNIDAKAYEEISKLAQENPNIGLEDPKLQALVATVVSNGVFLEIEDLSAVNIIDNKKAVGGFKINVKLTIDKDPKIAQLISVNPMMALSALNLDARIELSKANYKTILKTPRGAMLAMLPPKTEKDNFVYTIKYSKSKLIVNGMPLN